MDGLKTMLSNPMFWVAVIVVAVVVNWAWKKFLGGRGKLV